MKTKKIILAVLILLIFVTINLQELGKISSLQKAGLAPIMLGAFYLGVTGL